MSSESHRARLAAIFDEAVEAHRTAGQRPDDVLRVVDALVTAYRSGGKALIFGNGGSAADAQHFAAELVGRFQKERRALAAVALSTDTSILTAIANDYGYDRVFARQIEALGRRGDVAIGISTSGSSPNVLAAMLAARAAGLVTIAMTGRDGGTLAGAVDIHVNVPHPSTARVQEVQRTQMHVMCELVENVMAQA